MARKSTLGESTILRRSFGGCELASISRVAFSFLNVMYYMAFRAWLEIALCTQPQLTSVLLPIAFAYHF